MRDLGGTHLACLRILGYSSDFEKQEFLRRILRRKPKWSRMKMSILVAGPSIKGLAKLSGSLIKSVFPRTMILMDTT